MIYAVALLIGAATPSLIAFLNWRDARRLRANPVRR